jgi:predicted RNA binding protein YcfA (HicA-like mRNA interferase family)
MMLPRDLSAGELVLALARLGYQRTRTKGSHMRLTTQRGGQHHITVPDHNPLRVGTLAAILRDVAAHHGLSRDELLKLLFD